MYNEKIINLISEVLNLPKSYDRRKIEIEFNCPKCDNGKNKFNLSFNTDKNLFHCWACGYRGHVKKIFFDSGRSDLIEEYSKSIFDVQPKTKKIFSKTIDFSREFSLNSFRSMKVEWKDSLHYRVAKKYLKSRKIDNEIIDKWDICYAEDGPYSGRIIIPSKNINGKIEYFVGRDMYDTSKIKYKNPNIEKSSIIFGEKFIDWKKPVILTEGIFDAIILYNAIPLLGTDISIYKKLLNKILENKTPIIIGFDEDEAGKSGRINVAKYVEKLGGNLYIIENNKYNDLSSAFQNAGKDYIINLIRNSKPFDELELAISSIR